MRISSRKRSDVRIFVARADFLNISSRKQLRFDVRIFHVRIFSNRLSDVRIKWKSARHFITKKNYDPNRLETAVFAVILIEFTNFLKKLDPAQG